MALPLKILYEDNHLLVVDKPALVATMGALPGKPTLVEMAKKYIAEKYTKPGKVYLGVVSRLDAFVTGVIVFARTSKAADRLNQQFQKRTTKKTYWAIVPDRLVRSEGQLNDWVLKDDDARLMRVVPPETESSKQALLEYQTIGQNSNDDTVLVSIQLQTGRKHQIRVQFSNLKCPIIGDRKYGSPLPFQSGIALHSRFLTLEHPTKRNELTFESPVPKEWNLSQFVM